MDRDTRIGATVARVIAAAIAPETPQERADRLLRDWQGGGRVTATVNPFPSFEAAKASDMQRVRS